jgi:pre-mRNA-splicing factor ATP-dependent RNA helicase DHX15/PRP43
MITLVSMLSTESIWKKVLKINEEEYKEYIEIMKKFLCETGDHETMLNAYDAWMKCEDPNTYCDENFLNFRALRQADSINLQLHDILMTCNLEAAKRYYKNDPNYQ